MKKNVKKINFIYNLLSVANSTQVLNRDRLLRALHDRPPGTALITVANHHSCMDEPLIWGKLKKERFD